jgi:hypothetical protein
VAKDKKILEGLDLLGFAKLAQAKADGNRSKRAITAKVGGKPPQMAPQRAVTAKVSKPPV